MDHAVFYSEPMVLRFDSYENRIAKGKLQTVCYRTPFRFDSLDHLLMIMDDVLDSICFPRREGNLRHLDLSREDEEKNNNLSREDGEKNNNLNRTDERKRDILSRRDGQQTDRFRKIEQTEYIGNKWNNTEFSRFHGQMTVVVNRREHSSMQGTLVMDGDKVNFRSALELMHLFHEYLDQRFTLEK